MPTTIFRSLFCATALLLTAAHGPGCKPEATSAPAAPELPPPPPCIDNRCAERPGYLACIAWSNGGPAVCSKWKILYENNCVCHEWGPRETKPEGGAP